jgi:hypothetical protein
MVRSRILRYSWDGQKVRPDLRIYFGVEQFPQMGIRKIAGNIISICYGPLSMGARVLRMFQCQ